LLQSCASGRSSSAPSFASPRLRGRILLISPRSRPQTRAQVGFEGAHELAGVLFLQRAQALVSGPHFGIPFVGEAPRRDVVDELAHAWRKIQVIERSSARELPVLAGRRMKLELSGEADLAQQAVRALHLAGEKELGEDRFDRNTGFEQRADEGAVDERQRRRQHLLDGEVEISDELLELVVSEYTREAGVRQLERELGTILRKTATKLASGTAEAPIAVDLDAVRDALGRQRFFQEAAERTATPGVATGLAVTGTGGDVDGQGALNVWAAVGLFVGALGLVGARLTLRRT